jgi:hypothetical protein
VTEHFSGVRRAFDHDEQSLLVLLRQAHKDNGIFDDMNEEKVVAEILRGTRGGGGIIGVIDGPNGIEASVGLYLEQLWYSDTWWLVDHWNYVREDCRRSTHARRLIEWSKWCSDQMGVDLLMGVMSNKRTEAKVRLYRRQLPYIGAFFLHRANGADMTVA